MPIANILSRRTCAVVLSVCGSWLSANAHADTFISEIHYDNAGSDTNEAIEISTEVNTNLSTWSVSLYNGSNGSVYNTVALTGSVTADASCGSNGGTLVLDIAGIQNGSPDGIALVNGSDVVQFISYEGPLNAVDGPAAGMTSTDIGVSESSSTPATESLQLVNGVWVGPVANTFGTCTTEVAAGAPTPTPTPTPTATPVPSAISISELHYDNAGGDVDEAVEITGAAGTSLDGWQLALYNGSNNSVYNTVTLSGELVAAQGCSAGTLVQAISGIQNGSPDAIALLDASGSVVEFISYEGSLTAADGPALGMTSNDIGVAETSSTPVGFSLQKINGVWNAPAENTFGVCNDAGTAPTPTPTPVPEVVAIHTVQGNSNAIPNSAVFTIEAIVTADFQAQSQLRGFFVQEEDSDADSDPATSEGLFVFCGSCSVDVSVGDLVSVTGLANDFFDMTQINATRDTDITVLSSGNPMPSPVELALPVATTAADLTGATAEINAYFEQTEGMLVTFPAELTVSEHFALNRFGQVVLTANGRPRQFTDAFLPTEEGLIAHQIDLAARRIILDDDNNTQNIAVFNDVPVFLPQPGFSVDNSFRAGDTIENLTGVLHWSFAGSGSNAWRIRPVVENYEYTFESANPRTETPADVGGSLKVASFNVLNYFTTIDDGNPACGPQGTIDCRGANSPEELERQTRKIVSAICAIDADVVGLMEVQNLVEGMSEAPITTLVNAVNESCPTYAAIETGTVGTDAITVGLLYKLETVEAFGNTAILDDPSFTDPANVGRSRNRPVVAKAFKEIASERSFVVAVNHLKSKGSGCGAGDDDRTTGQANCNLTRTLAAEVETQWLAENPTGVDTDFVLVIGDMNAYRNEDPITAFKDAGYVDVIDMFEGNDAYSFIFDGQTGYLDHALASPELVPYITGVTEWHINADEVNLLDYNDTVLDSGERSFEAKPGLLPLYAQDPYRSADHDPVVVGIQFPDVPVCNSRVATIYVKDGYIVGGLQDGRRYRGFLFGTKEDDVIVGTGRSDFIFAGRGNDFVCAGDGHDKVIAGSGHDIVFGDGGNDFIFGQRGNDALYGGPGRNFIIGGKGNDECREGRLFKCEE